MFSNRLASENRVPSYLPVVLGGDVYLDPDDTISLHLSTTLVAEWPHFRQVDTLGSLVDATIIPALHFGHGMEPAAGAGLKRPLSASFMFNLRKLLRLLGWDLDWPASVLAQRLSLQPS